MYGYILNERGEVIAKARAQGKFRKIIFSGQTTAERINANRASNLVNARTGSLSFAVKHEKKWEKTHQYTGVEINRDEFLII